VYSEDSGHQKVLSEIQYANHSIKFYYTIAASKNNYYVKGHKVINDRKLQYITVNYNDVNLKTYWFNYGSEDLLTSIQLSVDGTSFHPLKFNWISTVPGGLNLSEATDNLSLEDAPVYLDFNGDGYDDVFAFVSNGLDENGNKRYKQKLRYNNGGSWAEILNEDIPIDKGNDDVLNAMVSDFVDMDGDGKTDLVYKSYELKKDGLKRIYTKYLKVKSINGTSNAVPICSKSYNILSYT
jgi:elongation factor P hydroxylase